MLENLTRDAFAQHLNSKFRVKNESSNDVELQLIEAEDLKSSSRQERFSIVFRGPEDSFLPQRTYQFEHDQIETFELFIVPIGKDRDGLYYQAIFSRLVE